MTDNQKKAAYVAIAVFTLAGAFAAGRYTLPAKTVTVEKTVEVEKVVTQTVTEWKERIVYVQKENRDVQTKTVVVKAPDGTETVTTETTDKTKVDTASSQEASSQSTQVSFVDRVIEVEKMKTVENDKDWHLSVNVGGGARFIGEVTPQLALGFQVERRMFGPLFMGARLDALAGIKPTPTIPLVPPVTVIGSLVFGFGF